MQVLLWLAVRPATMHRDQEVCIITQELHITQYHTTGHPDRRTTMYHNGRYEARIVKKKGKCESKQAIRALCLPYTFSTFSSFSSALFSYTRSIL